jgi:hypothetical protein
VLDLIYRPTDINSFSFRCSNGTQVGCINGLSISTGPSELAVE